MICTLIKWFISREEDTGKGLPQAIRRHIDRCESCRSYARFSKGLSERAKLDASSLVETTPEGLVEKIKTRSFETDTSLGMRRSRRWLIPALSGAAAVVLTAVILIFQPFQPLTPGRSEDRSQVFQALTLSGLDLRTYAGNLDSPYAREWTALKKTLQRSKGKLLAHLDLGINQSE